MFAQNEYFIIYCACFWYMDMKLNQNFVDTFFFGGAIHK